MTKYEIGYRKFEKFVSEHNLINEYCKEITAAYSGGKDASIMCEFLFDYKKRKNLNINIVLLIAAFPNFLYNPKDVEREMLLKKAYSYWEKKGAKISLLNYDLKDEYSFLNSENPCSICSRIKTELMGEYIRSDRSKSNTYALGMNFDDCISWMLEIVMLSMKYKSISKVKEENPALYKHILTLSVRILHHLVDSQRSIDFIRPIICFTNSEIKEIVSERNIPLIPEDCKAISGKNVFSDSPRREFSMAIELMRQKYNLKVLDNAASYNNYDTVYKFIKESTIFPSIDEINDYMRNSLMV